MNKLKAVAALVLIAVVGTACEDITNPIEEFGQLVDPFVRWEVSGSIGDPGQTIGVIIQLPTRLEEDVTYNYTLGGTAEFGTDYVVVEEDGTPRPDVTASGGSGTITYVENRDAFSRDTIFFAIDFGAEEGRTIELELTSAQGAASGRNVETGYIDRYRLHTLTIEPLPEGVWVGQRTGDFGTAAASVTITRDGGPFEVGGVLYGYEISDFTGDGGIFGIGIPWVFSVGTGGSVQAPASSHVFNVQATVTGSYDAGTETLTLNVTLNCCGAAGFGWTLVLTAP